MKTDDQSPDHQELGQRPAAAVDFAFLEAQTFGDVALQVEVLELFLNQARRLIPTLPGLSAKDQSDVVHLLKGSARGIGAWSVADEAAVFEAAQIALRPALFQRLAAAFEHAETAIRAWLADAHAGDAPPKATI